MQAAFSDILNGLMIIPDLIKPCKFTLSLYNGSIDFRYRGRVIVMNMKKKAAAACVAVMAAVSLPMGIVPVQPVQADLITDVIGGLQVKSALSKQIKHYDTTKEGQSEIYQSVTKQTGVLHNEYYNERLASIMNRLSARRSL